MMKIDSRQPKNRSNYFPQKLLKMCFVVVGTATQLVILPPNIPLIGRVLILNGLGENRFLHLLVLGNGLD